MASRAVWKTVCAGALLAPLGCGSTGAGASNDAGGAKDAAVDRSAPARDAARKVDGAPHDAAAPVDATSTCHGASTPSDRARKLVVSHPFDQAQNAASDFEVFDLDTTGSLSQPNVHFALGPTSDGEIVFTPDGEVGLVAEDDGTLGVFRFDATGAPIVVSASLAGSFYATSVVMDPSGARAYIVDDQTADNGAGIYTVSIACDGTVKDEGLLLAADLPATVIPLTNGEAIVVARNVRGAPAIIDGGLDDGAVVHDGGPLPGNDAVLVAWPDAGKVLGNADPFGDQLAIVAGAAITSDGRYVLIGDDSQFSGIPNRVGVVSVGAHGLSAAGVVENVNDPESLIASPFDDTVLVTSPFGNALFVLTHSDAGATPFSLAGPLAYDGGAPELPGPAVMLSRGTLTGRVFVGENQAIRQVQFAKGGVATDLGVTSSGDAGAFTTIVGAIGVQP